MAEADDRRWAAFEVALLVARQNGKGSILEARQLAGLFLLSERLAVHTSHEFKTTFEHFLRIVNLIESAPDLDARVARIRRGAGEQAIELMNGARLRFVARSTGSARGFSGDTVYLDEAYALVPEMMGALMPTLRARRNPQIWYTSSAPRMNSDVLHAVRRRGVRGDSDRLFFAEWSAHPDSALDDRDAWYQANPGLGIRIDEASMLAEYEALKEMPQEFARELLGIPEDPETAGVIPIDRWDALADEKSMPTGKPCLAFDVSPERSWASIGAAGRRADGLSHVEVVDRMSGTGWLVPRLVELWAKHHVPLRFDPSSPAGSFASDLRSRGVELIEVTGRDMAQACGAFADAVQNETVRHLGSPAIHNALTGAGKRSMGDAWAWSRVSSSVDITPLVAVTLAHAGLPDPGGAAHVWAFTD